ncbi:MAG: nucleoside diphosphate kinase regulator [Verrucomicrobiota bacterium]
MQHIYITENDFNHLQNMMAQGGKAPGKDLPYLQSLEHELARATIVPSDQIPKNVITMHSQARLQDLDTKEDMTYTLTFPDKADAAANKISVLAPVGTAMIGCKVGDTISWEVPAGARRLKVISIIYQPEAAGKFD